MILHVDGNSFFASCEIALNPALRGKAVVTGSERGIASAMSPQAKKCGVVRGMPIGQVRQICPQAVIVASCFPAYKLFSERMAQITARFATVVEKYSIDECFAVLPADVAEGTEESVALALQQALLLELDLPFSVGVAPTKTLAKLASGYRKPLGLTVIHKEDINNFLSKIPIGDVWGIGHRSAPMFRAYGWQTAFDFIRAEEKLVIERFSVPYQVLWYELKGQAIHKVHSRTKLQQSVSHTRTFTPSTDRTRVRSELMRNIERAFAALRRQGLYARGMHLFLKTNDFRYTSLDLVLPNSVASSAGLITELSLRFDKLFVSKTNYRATGVTLNHLSPYREVSLFGNDVTKDNEEISTVMDTLEAKYGKPVIFLGSSAHMKSSIQNAGPRSIQKTENTSVLFPKSLIDKRLLYKKFSEKHLEIIYLGQAG